MTVINSEVITLVRHIKNEKYDVKCHTPPEDESDVGMINVPVSDEESLSIRVKVKDGEHTGIREPAPTLLVDQKTVDLIGRCSMPLVSLAQSIINFMAREHGEHEWMVNTTGTRGREDIITIQACRPDGSERTIVIDISM